MEPPAEPIPAGACTSIRFRSRMVRGDGCSPPLSCEAVSPQGQACIPSIRRTGGYGALALPNFRNPAEAARAWADKEEQRLLEEQKRLALEQRMEEVKPKVVFAESIEVAKTSISVGEMAKLIKQATGYDIGQNRFFEWLRNRGYLHKDGSQTNMPTQRSMDAGWMEIKEGTRIGSSGESRITRTPKITGKGQIYFINLFKKMVES